jgi:tetratricopeptide (TPR) repeat protein
LIEGMRVKVLKVFRNLDGAIIETYKCILISILIFFGIISSFAADNIWFKNSTVDGKSVRMCFDSGSSAAVLTSEAVERLKLKVLVPPTNGLGDTAVCDASLDGIPFQTDFRILKWPSYAKPDCDAIMGWGPLSSNILQIDANALKLKILRDVPSRVKRWTKFPLVPDSGTLDLEIPHKGSTDDIIAIDTGGDDGFELTPKEWKAWRKAHSDAPVTLRTYMTVDGLFVSEESWADKIQIGPLVVTDVPVMEEDGAYIKKELGGECDILGIVALERLDLVVDGIHSVAYLQAKTTPPRPYLYNRLGAVFCPATEGDSEAVAKVVPSSPAFEAGIRDGDVLLRLNGMPALCWTNGWWHDFEKPAGTVLHMVLQRKGTNFEVTVVLNEILHPGEHFQESAATGDLVDNAEPDTDAAEDTNGIDEKAQIAKEYYDLGDRERRAGNLSGALTNFSMAIQTDSELAGAYAARGYVEQLQTNIDGAISDYDKAIELKPDYAEAYCDRGSAKQAKGDLAGALADCSKAIELRPNDATFYFYRALAQGTNSGVALADCSKAIQLKPDYLEAYFYRGGIERYEGDLDGALGDYSNAIQIKPDYADAYGDRGAARQCKGDLKGALADYNKAIALEPESAEIYADRGSLEEAMGKLDLALSDDDRAIELDPHSAEPYGNRSGVEAIKGDLDRAEADCAEAVGLKSDLATTAAEIFKNLGWSRYERQEYADALSDFQRACKLDPSQDYARFGAWLSGSLLGKSKATTMELKEYLAGHPTTNSDDWPSQIGRFLAGQITEQELLAAAEDTDSKKDHEQKCEAYFYIGSRHLIAGDKARAEDLFEKCVATGIQNFSEYQCAKAELNTLNKVN